MYECLFFDGWFFRGCTKRVGEASLAACDLLTKRRQTFADLPSLPRMSAVCQSSALEETHERGA